jgi:hypothetical protein
MLTCGWIAVEVGMTTAVPEGDAGTGPTVLRILLGGQLRKLREARGVTREAAGWQIRSSESKISRMELGRVGFKERDVADLLTFYGVTDEEERSALVTLARQANAPGWWHQYADVLPTWFQSYLGLESAASLIRNYEVQFVPGLLQTADYARAVIKLGYPAASAAELDRRVQLRMTRQELLSRANPPTFWAVIDEAALRRPIGGKAVLRGQLARLIELAKLPNVTIQLIPFGAGGHAAHGGAFSILRFPDRDLPDVVYMEQMTSALYLDKPEDLEHYATVMTLLTVDATQPAETLELLAKFAQELDRS